MFSVPPPPSSSFRGVRYLHASGPRFSQHTYAAVVAGAGPAGLAVMGNVLDSRAAGAGGKVLWVDPAWQAGMVGARWREVPSNTKTKLFVAFAEATAAFRDVIAAAPAPNALTALKELPQDEGCQIAYAADMCAMLTDGVVRRRAAEQGWGTVTGADWDNASSSWTVQIQAPRSPRLTTVASSRLILCTGATPSTIPLRIPGLGIEHLALDTVFSPTALAARLPRTAPATVGVVGSSHSAVLVLLNLVRLAQTSHPRLRARWFARAPLRYAVERDGWIERDNTGLKGVAAAFARAQLEDDALPSSPAGAVVEKVDCAADERGALAAHLPGCSHVVHAVGFAPRALPALTRGGRPLGALRYDHEGGGFVDDEGREVPGLFGAGIAFPERVTDPEGNVEMAVGLWKFMKYLKRVTPAWLGEAVGEAKASSGEQKAAAAA